MTTAVYPHLPYLDAVLAALDTAGLPPDEVDTGADQHHDLDAYLSWNRAGVHLRWDVVRGWQADADRAAGPLPIPTLADAAVIADTVRLLTDGQPATPRGESWAGARELDVALSEWEDLS